jgi:hypothetical protein
MNDKTGSNGDDGSLSGLGIGEAVKGVSGKLGGVARDAAANLIETPKAAGADAIEGVGRAVRNAADDIGKESPVVAGYVRDAAVNIDRVAGGLRDHSVGDLLAMATKFGREQPVAFFAGAVIAGFALSRFVKVGATEAPPSTNEVGE